MLARLQPAALRALRSELKRCSWLQTNSPFEPFLVFVEEIGALGFTGGGQRAGSSHIVLRPNEYAPRDQVIRVPRGYLCALQVAD
jgi:hypothetical protein